MQYVMNGWPDGTVEEQLRPYTGRRDLNFAVTMDVSCVEGVIVPAKGRANVLEELHMAHPGATCMKRIAHTLVWWPGLDKEIEQHVHSCVECQINLPAPPSSPWQLWRWPPGHGPGYMQTLLVHFWAVCFWLWWMPTPSG